MEREDPTMCTFHCFVGVLPPTEENIEALSPAAAAASRLLKSGMTLTQVHIHLSIFLKVTV